eukprot:767396-Hanusia_phi.AAC.2
MKSDAKASDSRRISQWFPSRGEDAIIRSIKVQLYADGSCRILGQGSNVCLSDRILATHASYGTCAMVMVVRAAASHE